MRANPIKHHIALFFTALALLAGPWLRAQAPSILDAPKPIQDLSAGLQGKRPAAVRDAIIKRLGPPQRSVGSGLRIDQWNTAGGTLIFHPGQGPTFDDSKSKVRFHLMRTNNPVGANLVGDYQMTTPPDPANHGMMLWLGSLKLGADKTYQFKDSGQFPNQHGAQSGNFFVKHPVGSVEIRYATPVEANTLLESVAGESTIAHLVFTSADDKSHATLAVTSSEQSRRLDCGAEGVSFRISKSWNNFWQ